MQSIKNLSFLALACSLIISALGCQQTQIAFTPKAAPKLPVFDKLTGAPEIAPLKFQQTSLSKLVPVSPKLDLYLFDDTLSGLNHLSLVAYSKLPMENLDVLLQAFDEKRAWLVQQSTLACAESLNIRPTMHSLTISIDCPDSPILASELLMQFWQADDVNQMGSFDEIDIANVRRQLKLAKHINAYSGAEIDDVWAKKILGKQHVYNQALNDKTLADELDLSSLNQVRDKILAQSNWAFFANRSLEQDQGFTLAVTQQFESLMSIASKAELSNSKANSEAYSEANSEKSTDSATISGSAINTRTETSTSADIPPSNNNKTLYLIDVPGSVQTQVRIGYPLGNMLDGSDNDNDKSIDSAQDCKLLASWLGRSFSGRLYYDLREIRGLTYGIYGRCFDNPLSRTLKFYGSTKLEHSGAFISGVLDHLALTTDSTASLDELTALKTYLTSQQILRQANFRAVEADTIKQLIRGVSPEQELAQNQRLSKLTPEQLQQIARSVFLNTPYIVIRGDRDKIEADLKHKLADWNIVEVVAD
ncbi:insulinase family protein [Shewanella pealeana]|uniref:Peptidase M16 domain protein n=1 Tax=Shewanella pealeana (strain ATCC 700345 / ANG-SQ1) TaxID=398579 RepID=A8H872_SHEPA|nr:insulinase family protein [Shewanella pealeana]ABV88759.1 peptidase M16 domain protein [Shewanella pealeana ATCC 700345]